MLKIAPPIPSVGPDPKLGALMAKVPFLLQNARRLKLNVIGVTFDIGKTIKDDETEYYRTAIQSAREAWDIGTSLGFQFTTLDMKLGLTGSSDQGQFVQSASVINESLSENFPDSDPRFANIKLIGEDGKMFVDGAFTLCTEIIGKRFDNNTFRSYYINDGFYQNLYYYVVSILTKSTNCLSQICAHFVCDSLDQWQAVPAGGVQSE